MEKTVCGSQILEERGTLSHGGGMWEAPAWVRREREQEETWTRVFTGVSAEAWESQSKQTRFG